MLLNFILAIVKMFDKSTPEDKPDGPVKPKPSPKRRPLKDLIDSIVPWREQK